MSLIIWSLVWAAACSSPGLEVRAASILSTEPGAVDPPWLAIFHCFQSDSPTVCFQKRAVRALEDMFIKEDVDDKSVEQEEKGLSPAVGKIIDRIGDLIASGLSQWYPESDGEPEDLDTAKVGRCHRSS
ncbi:uncharacterized protein LOC124368720 [Homalodisca vitripennis]|uniref:uncharacterized protein LOC124368720 n=1 Tax=Homalodisca vitripennis TaxID=197043 RepID=UPI001EEB0C48|nr:uncharacterized protein LOC124368720 [Homalodisca vitripennis]